MPHRWLNLRARQLDLEVRHYAEMEGPQAIQFLLELEFFLVRLINTGKHNDIGDYLKKLESTLGGFHLLKKLCATQPKFPS